MCLERIEKRTVQEEGIGYKLFLITTLHDEEEWYSSTRKFKILTDCWLLNKEPGNPHRVKCKYQHGFHMYKRIFKALDEYCAYSNRDHAIQLIKEGYMKIIPKKVFWKGYIAEDETQIVSKCIYIPHKTKGPTEQTKEIEVKELIHI